MQNARPITFPQSIPLPIRKTANQRKVLRIVKLVAPKAFRTPIIFVRSIMIISKPEIMVKPATPIIRNKITHTFRSNSQAMQISVDSTVRYCAHNTYLHIRLSGYRYRLRFHTLYLPAYHSLSAEAPPLSPAPAANRSNDSPN